MNSLRNSSPTRYAGLSEHLTARAAAVGNKRSAEHSRLLILVAAARMAGTRDFLEIRVPDVCRACSISRATFYLHFDGRDALFAELMRQLTALEKSLTPSLAGCADVVTGVKTVVDWYIDVHLANASLFQNLTFLRRTNQEINESWLERARVLHRAVADELNRFPEFRALPPSESDFVLEFFGGGMNSVISRVNTKLPRNPFVPAELDAVKASVARLLHRSLFGIDAGAAARRRPARMRFAR
ncbi:MAG: TetR/AcrR family transcriptional regulator [Steroidobacteraceae bacterium]